MKPSPQAFWLEKLDQAATYTGWVFEQAQPHLTGSVLEVGCGRGTYTRLLAQSASKVVALDIDEAFVSAARAATSSLPNVELRLADVTTERYEEEFDGILMLDVLEHVSDDEGLLRALLRALRPRGRLVLKVPAFEWLYGAMDRAVGHHRRYSRDVLSERLLGSGFLSPQVWYFNAAAIPGWWLNGAFLRRTTPPAAQLSAFETLLPLVRKIDRVACNWLGLSLFAVAEKPASPLMK